MTLNAAWATWAGRTEMRLAVIFHRLGPYHYARLRAANRVKPIVALELSGEDKTYAWAHVTGDAEFERHVIFPAVDCESLLCRRIYDGVRKKLDAIRPDAVVIPGFYDKGALSSLMWCNEHGVPGIVVSDTTQRDFRRHFWREWVKRKVTARFSAALVGGQAQAEYLVKLGMREDRIFPGYDVVDNEYFSTRADQVRQNARRYRDEHSLPEQYFLTSNRFIARKNLFRLATAYAEYRRQAADPWDLVMLGDGELMPLLTRHIDALGLRDHILLPGFRQYEELPIYYALAGCYIQASTAEPWGLTVNEAMASGLPVLVSNVCGCAKDLLREPGNGFALDPCDTANMAQKMLRISDAGCDREAMGRMSRQIISQWGCGRFGENLWKAAERACQDPVRRNDRTGALILKALVFLK